VDAESFQQLCHEWAVRRSALAALKRDHSLGIALGGEWKEVATLLKSPVAVSGFNPEENEDLGIRLASRAWLLPADIVQTIASGLAVVDAASASSGNAVGDASARVIEFYQRAAKARQDVVVFGAPDPRPITASIKHSHQRALIAEENRRHHRLDRWRVRILELALSERGSPDPAARVAAYHDLWQAMSEEDGRAHYAAATQVRGLWADVLSSAAVGRVNAVLLLTRLALALEVGGDGAGPARDALTRGLAEISSFLDEVLDELPAGTRACFVLCVAIIDPGRARGLEIPAIWQTTVAETLAARGVERDHAFATLEQSAIAEI
jgi:hypothetical protein